MGIKIVKKKAISKKIVFLILIVLCILIFCISTSVSAKDKTNDEVLVDLEKNVEKQVDNLDISGIEKLVRQLDNSEINGTVKDSLLKIIKGEFNYGFKETITFVFRCLGGQVLNFFPTMFTIIAICIIFSIINGMSSGFLASNTKEVIYFVCYGAIIILIASKTMALILITKNTLTTMQNLMNVTFPILLTMLASVGGVVSATTYQPLLVILSTFIINFVVKIILPCFIATLIFSIVGNLSKNIKLDKITKFFKSFAEVSLGFMFSLFIAFTTLQGVAGSNIDSISIKGAKFALNSYVPILGGYLTDGFDLVLASCVLIKNSVGYFTIIVLVLTIIAPVLQIIIFSLGLKLTAGIVEPICDKRISGLIYSTSKNINILVAIILGVSFLFFIVVLLIMTSCNLGG